MKSLKKKTKTTLIIVAVSLLVVSAVLMILVPSLIQPILYTLLVLIVGFLAIEFMQRQKKRKKLKDFDEQVSAKEGIEDRKREWNGWIEELDRQGIDRYELPFYMIVGEPQSGKSVLLQNSDLYFPFGQDRLSGVGGTRGCDWWFTDEAVILDIAGRLFTHEGGAADKLEWEAFLDLLNGFRPMCPANGILLVVPCDALLEDSPETCADKANKIQSALLTLTQKLQAQLPVYLVLTKADKIFGFAESVHRLDADDRHQMFGWSRDKDRTEQAFALDEAKSGFARLVDRAKLLRERMIASARLPEALPEIDRLYAFPDELAGMYGSLETYLKRIFTESALVERMSFRGIYLCSGLQSGVPIAKVCGDLLGGDRESDARGLESLFSHQRAYFIKDMVRNRVFAERGLVRPTEGRVAAARRNAIVGYGAAGAVAVAALVGAVITLMSETSSELDSTFTQAITAARSAPASVDVPDLLGKLHRVHAAADVDEGMMKETFQDTQDDFESLYATACETALLPKLREQLELRLLNLTESPPNSGQQFQEILDSAIPLFAEKGLDFNKGANQKIFRRWLPGQWATQIASESGPPTDFSVADALGHTDGSTIAPIYEGSKGRLRSLATRLSGMLDSYIDAKSPWMVEGHLGYMVAWLGAQKANQEIAQTKNLPGDDFLELTDTYANAIQKLDDLANGGTLIDGVTYGGTGGQITTLTDQWLTLQEFLNPGGKHNWSRLKPIETFCQREFQKHKSNAQLPSFSPAGGAIGRAFLRAQQALFATAIATIPMPANEPKKWTDDSNGQWRACKLQPHNDWTIREIADPLRTNSEQPDRLYVSKVKVLAKQLETRYADWNAARQEFWQDGSPPAESELDQELLATLADIRGSLASKRYGVSESKATSKVSGLIDEHLRAIQTAWAARTEDGAWGESIDWELVQSLNALAANRSVGAPSSIADTLRWRYLNHHEKRLLDEWRDRTKEKDVTLEIIGALNDHLEKLESLRTKPSSTTSAVELNDRTHVTWLDDVDELVANRLHYHVTLLKTHWSPNTAAWTNLRKTKAGIEDALDERTLEEKIVTARELDYPPPNSPELLDSLPISTATFLEKTKDELTELRKFEDKGARDFTRDEITGLLQETLAEVDRHIADNRPHAIAGTALRLTAPSDKPFENTVQFYLRPLQQKLRERLESDVRQRYIRELAQKVNPQLLTTLFASNVADINSAAENEDVLGTLNALLRDGGILDSLRDRYRMKKDALDENARDLRPADDWTAPDADRDWWETERFLIGLQTFLKEPGVSIEESKFEIRPAIPRSGRGNAWNINQNGSRKFFYHATAPSGSAIPGFSAWDDKRWAKLKKFDWEFQPDVDADFWFYWSNTTHRGRFKWPDDRPKGAAWVTYKGPLAPLLVAWSGDPDPNGGKTWTAQLRTEDGGPTGKLELTFARNGAELDLPVRPAQKPKPY